MAQDQSELKEETSRPPIPKIAYLVVNPLMKLLLRSPLHGLISDDLMLITFTGRKSGKTYTTPVGYIMMEEDTLMIFTESPWWRNLDEVPEVTLRLRGERVQGRAEIIEDPDQIKAYLHKMAEKRGEEMLERMGMDVFDQQGGIDLDHPAVQRRKFIRIQLEGKA
jgi:deazaflavin-dependent oxidoreductase (nitroreductase family)